MSEEFNIFEEERAKEIIWNQIIQDFAETKMPIRTFCKVKEIEETELRDHLNQRMEKAREEVFQKSIVFTPEDVVEINPENELTDSEKQQKNYVTIRFLQIEIQIPLNAKEEVYRNIIKAVKES